MYGMAIVLGWVTTKEDHPLPYTIRPSNVDIRSVNKVIYIANEANPHTDIYHRSMVKLLNLVKLDNKTCNRPIRYIPHSITVYCEHTNPR